MCASGASAGIQTRQRCRTAGFRKHHLKLESLEDCALSRHRSRNSRSPRAPPLRTRSSPGPDGNLWFTENDAVSNAIGKITPSGLITEYTIPTSGSNPFGITVGPDGNLWFTEEFGDKIGVITSQRSDHRTRAKLDG